MTNYSKREQMNNYLKHLQESNATAFWPHEHVNVCSLWYPAKLVFSNSSPLNKLLNNFNMALNSGLHNGNY